MSYTPTYSPYATPEYAVADTSTALIGIVVVLIYLAIVFAVIVFSYICNWKLFKKMGEPGWKCLIPIYNMIILYQRIGLSPYLLFIYLASFIPLIGMLAVIVMTIIQYVYLAKAFNKGAGFILGLLFIPIIFYPILAFSKKSEYALSK